MKQIISTCNQVPTQKRKSGGGRIPFATLTAITMIALAGCANPPTGSDKVIEQGVQHNILDVDHAGATRLAKTDYAEVIEVNLAAGEAIPRHSGGDRIILSLNDNSLNYKGADGQKTQQFGAGDVHFRPAGAHSVENVGTGKASFVIFERLLTGNLPDGEPKTEVNDTPTPGLGAREEKLFTNDSFDVYKVSIDPNGKLEPHMGYARAVYSLDDYKIGFHENGSNHTRTFAKGNVHFHNPGSHWIENKGETRADFIVVDIKE